jgi:hypothetical protein
MYFYVAHIYCFNPVSMEEEVIRVTNHTHYVSPDAETYLPYLKVSINFEETLFSRGSTSGEASVGVGELVLDNNDGTFDAYTKFGFDGRTVELFRLESDTDYPDDTNVFFRGVGHFFEPGFSQVSIHIRNRLEILKPLIQASVFAGTNDGGDVGYEGNEGDLKGKTKPMVWGTCLNVPMAPLNKSMLIYGCNHDKDGNPAPVAKFFNVADKGGAILYAGNVANLAALHAATVPKGFYKSCIAAGAIKVRTVPLGDITADVASVLGEGSSAPMLVKTILEDVYDLVADLDFDVASLEALHDLNMTACGYYVDEEVEGLTVINDLLSSIGGWMVPDRLGEFQFGRFDLPEVGDPTVATFTLDTIKKDSLSRQPTGDEGQGSPAKSYTLYHSKLWKVLPRSDTIVSVEDSLREYYSQEFRSSHAEDDSVLTVHPLAPDLSDESLMVVQPSLKVTPFRAEDVGHKPSNWDFVPVSNTTEVVIVDGKPAMKIIGFEGSVFFALGLTTGGYFTSSQAALAEEFWDGDFTLTYKVLSADNPSTVYVFVISTNTVLQLDGTPWVFFPDPVVGENSVDFRYSGYSDSHYVWITVDDAGGAPGNETVMTDFKITPRPMGLTPQEEADRRLEINAADLARYTFDVPLAEGLFVNLGEKILLQLFGRFGLTAGKEFVVIGKNTVTEEDKVAFDVIGAE